MLSSDVFDFAGATSVVAPPGWDGSYCPACGSTDGPTYRNTEGPEAGMYWQPAWCSECGAEWSDVYVLLVASDGDGARLRYVASPDPVAARVDGQWSHVGVRLADAITRVINDLGVLESGEVGSATRMAIAVRALEQAWGCV